MSLIIIREDITRIHVDAIVNAANTNLSMGSGVCGAIFSAAGAAKLQAACDKLAPIATGEAVITPAFNLPAHYIIHTAGPIYRNGTYNEAELLRSCYDNCLNLAEKNQCDSLAFPLISSGIYGYPAKEALSIAVERILHFLETHDMRIFLTLMQAELFQFSKEQYQDEIVHIDSDSP